MPTSKVASASRLRSRRSSRLRSHPQPARRGEWWANSFEVVAHKTGTGGTPKGITSATNDIGIITLPNGQHLAVDAFVSDSAANDDRRDATIARLAKAAWDRAQSR